MPSDELEVQGVSTDLGSASGQRPDEYMREPLEQIQAAQVHLKALIDEHAPTVTVTAVTAVPMNGLMRAKVMATAQKLLKAQIFLRERVDPSILGGVVLETPTRRYDASVATQLANVHKELITATEEGGA